jgi:hypothetical protein
MKLATTIHHPPRKRVRQPGAKKENEMSESVYPEQDHEDLGEHYMRHVEAMTAEGLHEKSAIAGQLAWRDRDLERLRKLLACAYAGASLYGDDGELQDNSRHPLIDFKRDTPDEIARKMRERGIAAINDSQCNCWLGTNATFGDSEVRKRCPVHGEAAAESAKGAQPK